MSRFAQLLARLEAVTAPNDDQRNRVISTLMQAVGYGRECSIVAADVDEATGHRALHAAAIVVAMIQRRPGQPGVLAGLDRDKLMERFRREYPREWNDASIAKAIALGRQVRAALAAEEAIKP